MSIFCRRDVKTHSYGFAKHIKIRLNNCPITVSKSQQKVSKTISQQKSAKIQQNSAKSQQNCQQIVSKQGFLAVKPAKSAISDDESVLYVESPACHAGLNINSAGVLVKSAVFSLNQVLPDLTG